MSTFGHNKMRNGQANGVRGGIIPTVTFQGLTPEEREDARLIARASFWELSRIALHMNELSMTFTEARRHHHQQVKAAQA